jgi:serine/threonine-protein kinase
MGLEAGETFDRYVVGEKLGEGGMGAVYRARDPRLQRDVALKVLARETGSEGSGGSARMMREARAVAALDHPNVVSVFDVGEVDGTPFIAMELVEGRSLRSFVGEARTPPGDKVRWLADVARALHAAHEKGVVHRDVKPENVMVRKDGAVKVLDFGVARASRGARPDWMSTVTGEGLVVGTPLYMAPEQLRGEELDGRTDQFAWGAMAYELLSGAGPWASEKDGAAVVAAIVSKEPAPLVASGVSAAVTSVVHRALAKAPDARFPTMRDVASALDQASATSGAVAAAFAKTEAAPAAPVERSARRGRAALAVVVAGVVVAGVAAAAIALPRLSRKPDPAAASTSASASAPVVAVDKSVAVLPLVNTGGDSENEYFSDGLTEELINALGRAKDLKVIGRTSSFRFKGTTDDSRTIGAKLGVAYLLEGSVRKSGDRVRIAVDLVKASDAGGVWSQTYDRRLDDVFAVQSDIATEVAQRLQATLATPDAAAAPAALTPDRPPSGNVDAYNALLLGNYHYAQRSRESLGLAKADLERAIALDAGYAQAHAKLAIVLLDLEGSYAWSAEERRRLVEEARAETKLALSLGPDLAAAHVARAYESRFVEWDLPSAAAEIRRARELSPGDASVLLDAGLAEAERGHIDAALALFAQVIVLDPLSTRAYHNQGVAEAGAGDFAASERSLRQAIVLQPGGSHARAFLMAVLILEGKVGAAAEVAKTIDDPYWSLVGSAMVADARGDRAASEAAVKKMLASDAEGASYQVAQIHALRHDADGTFAWLDRAWEHDAGIWLLRYDPIFTSVRSDPRYAAFIKKMGAE